MPTFKPGHLDNEELKRTQMSPFSYNKKADLAEQETKRATGYPPGNFSELKIFGQATADFNGTVQLDKAQTVSTTRLVMLLDLATLTVEEIGSKAKRRNYKGLKVWEKKLLALAEKALAQP